LAVKFLRSLPRKLRDRIEQAIFLMLNDPLQNYPGRDFWIFFALTSLSKISNNSGYSAIFETSSGQKISQKSARASFAAGP
jgi:hypothetical protein